MMKADFKVTMLDRFPAEVRAVIVEELQKELDALMLELEGRVKDQLIDKGASASGAAGLVGSWHVKRPAGVEQGAVAISQLASSSLHAGYVELGTRGAPRKMPPLKPIYSWVERKLDVVAWGVNLSERGASYSGNVVRQFPRKGGTSRSRLNRARAILRVARAIQRAIQLRGTKARYYMRDALQSLRLPHLLVDDARTQSKMYMVDAEAWLAGRAQLWNRVKRRLRGSAPRVRKA